MKTNEVKMETKTDLQLPKSFLALALLDLNRALQKYLVAIRAPGGK